MQSVYHQPGIMRYLTALMALVVGLSALLLYLGTLSHGFVADDFIFLHQLHFSQPDVADSFAYFGRDWGMGAEFYRPMTRVYWAFLYWLAGESAWAWHLVGAALYGLTAMLVSLVGLRLSGNYVVGLLAGLLFAAHPAHVETVSWIANSSDLLACIFCLVGALAYVGFRQTTPVKGEPNGINPKGEKRRRAVFYAATLLSFFAGLLSKESAAGFIVVPLAYDAIFAAKYRIGRMEGGPGTGPVCFIRVAGEWLARQLPFVGVLLVYLWLRLNALGELGGYASVPDDGLSLGVLVNAYAKWLLLPLQLNKAQLFFLFGPVVVMLVGVLIYRERSATLAAKDDGGDLDGEDTPQVSYPLAHNAVFGFCWILLFLAPTVTTPPSIRFTYISTVGVSLLWAALLSPMFGIVCSTTAKTIVGNVLSKLPVQRAVGWVKIVLAGGLLLFSVMGTIPSLDAWRRAGETAGDILAQVRAGRTEPADYTPVYAAGLPDANEEALIFRTGFPEAIQLLYDNTTIQGLPVAAFPVVEQRLNEAYFVEYRDGKIVPRDDLVAMLQERNKEVKAKTEQPFKVWDFASPGARPEPWELLSGEGSVEARPGSLDVHIPKGGFVRPSTFRLNAPSLSWFEMTAHATPSSLEQTVAQIVVHWVVDTPGGTVERTSAPLVIALDGESHTYKVKPPDMSQFYIDDVVSEVRIELPPGIAALSVEKAQLFKLPLP